MLGRQISTALISASVTCDEECMKLYSEIFSKMILAIATFSAPRIIVSIAGLYWKRSRPSLRDRSIPRQISSAVAPYMSGRIGISKSHPS